MTLTDVIVLALAAGAIIDVWHNGSIFETRIAVLQAKQDALEPGSWWNLWYELLLCPYCKSYHIPVYLGILLVASPWPGLIKILVYGLAATRLSNLIDQLLPARMRYKRDE